MDGGREKVRKKQRIAKDSTLQNINISGIWPNSRTGAENICLNHLVVPEYEKKNFFIFFPL